MGLIGRHFQVEGLRIDEIELLNKIWKAYAKLSKNYHTDFFGCFKKSHFWQQKNLNFFDHDQSPTKFSKKRPIFQEKSPKMGFFEKILYDNSYSVLHELFKSCSTAQFHWAEGPQLENFGLMDPFKSLCTGRTHVSQKCETFLGPPSLWSRNSTLE